MPRPVAPACPGHAPATGRGAGTLLSQHRLTFNPVWNRAPFRQRSLADRVTLNNRNDKRTKENGVSLWRMAYTDSTGAFNWLPALRSSFWGKRRSFLSLLTIILKNLNNNFKQPFKLFSKLLSAKSLLLGNVQSRPAIEGMLNCWVKYCPPVRHFKRGKILYHNSNNSESNNKQRIPNEEAWGKLVWVNGPWFLFHLFINFVPKAFCHVGACWNRYDKRLWGWSWFFM